MSIASAISYFVLIGLLAAIPSTSVVMVVTHAATLGRVNGAAVALGIVFGDIVYVLVALLGLSTVAELSACWFAFVKTVGGGYLVWMGLAFWKRDTKQSSSFDASINTSSITASLFAGLLLTLADAKAIIFYASVFPALVNLNSPSLADCVLVVAITMLAVGGTKLLYVVLAHKFVNRHTFFIAYGAHLFKVGGISVFLVGGYMVTWGLYGVVSFL